MMNQYINANSLVREIELSKKNNHHNNAIASQTHNAEHRHFIRMVLDQPIADVVEVIRCKDCKYHRDLDGGVKCERMDGLLMTLPNDFCSYGRGRTEE